MKRTQILFPEDEYRYLRREAAARHCSVGHLVREAVGQVYLAQPRQARLDAARELIEMDLPVADWPQIEEEIERGARDE
jgi:hypothetical protein